MIKQPTYYQNPNKPTCFDLTLTNFPRMFQSKLVIEAGLSDFHLVIKTVMKRTFKKIRPRVINHRSYRDFSNETLGVPMIHNLSNEAFVNNDDELEKLSKTAMDTLNSFAPIKKKYSCDYQLSFMIKKLSREIMTRSKFRNKYLKHKAEQYHLLHTQQKINVFLFSEKPK